jgi:hypothetical protein
MGWRIANIRFAVILAAGDIWLQGQSGHTAAQ